MKAVVQYDNDLIYFKFSEAGSHIKVRKKLQETKTTASRGLISDTNKIISFPGRDYFATRAVNVNSDGK